MEEPAAPMTAITMSATTSSHHFSEGKGPTVVAQGNKLDIKDTTVVLPDTTHADSVTLRELAVQSGLRPIGLVEHLDGWLRSRGASQPLCLGDIFPHGLLHLFGRWGRALGESQGHTCGVTIQHGDPVAGCRDSQRLLIFEGGRLGVDAAQNLLCFRLELVLLARNEGHHVVNDVHAANTGVSRTRHGLHGHDGDGIDLAKTRLQGGEGDHEPNDGAVAVAHEEALVQTKRLLLVGDEVEMVEVDGRDDKGDERIAAVVLRIGEDGKAGILELLLNVTGDVAVEAAEDNVAVGELAGLAVANDQVADIGSDGLCLLPPDSIAVLLPGGSRRGTQAYELERRVLLEEQDEALADRTSAAEHTCSGVTVSSQGSSDDGGVNQSSGTRAEGRTDVLNGQLRHVG